MTTNEVLKNISKLLDSPDKWTTGALAVDSDGLSVPTLSEDAVSWCLLGALKHEARTSRLYLSADKRIWAAVKAEYPGRYLSLSQFNDSPTTTFEDVQRILKLASK